MRRAQSSRAGLVASTVVASRPAAALAAAGVTPRRSRGQNFLVQPRVADRIVALAELGANDAVIEIGPGLGILTERIAAAPVRRLILIELDERLAARLMERYAGDARVNVINRDFLSLGRDEIAVGAPLKIVGNLPFNVAAAILERLAAWRGEIVRMVLMFQREVGERIRARPGSRDYGALSVYTALYWEITSHFRVGAGCFHPRPKVDAEVLAFAPRPAAPVDAAGERALLATIRAAFSAPRKTLRNALGRTAGLPAGALDAALAAAAIDPAARAATLAVEDLSRLAEALMRARAAIGDRDA